ncbi:3-deoxy-D-manno-octulosonic acid kinase [Veronia pacifica]|uniref:3-deoxy-D-manno-octulosonic acid kinase n=1 Tax=Veronia pacifica TaxID=1080227 RepID=A0A1C3EGN8_9GAMM|nr:3-deoxy-D-manno-octulosonic acid kinase [Veronia pacifica]
MVQLQGGKGRLWYNPQLASSQPERCFDIDYWRDQGAIIGSAQGRGTTWFIQLDQVAVALRHYIRGGLFGRLVKDSYLFTGWQNTRAYREYSLLASLAEKGLPVPRPVAAKAERSGLMYRADLVVEKVPDARDLVAVLEKSSLDHEVYVQIGRLVRQLHDVGVCHTDLNIHNILLGADDKLWLIDFDKCGVKKGESWKQDNLSRLKRSFIKEQGRFSIHWQEEDWQSLLSGYRT